MELTAENYIVVEGDDIVLTCSVSGSLDSIEVTFESSLANASDSIWSTAYAGDVINFVQDHVLTIASDEDAYGNGTYSCKLDDYDGFTDSIEIMFFTPGKLLRVVFCESYPSLAARYPNPHKTAPN